MAEELLVVLSRSENTGFGFSLLGKPGLPPIIYNILDDSPAAESGEVEVGDVILKINETDVNRFSTKEVLKCLRLSSDPVRLKIKRDPKIKATIRKHLLSSATGDDIIKTKGNFLNSTKPIDGNKSISSSCTTSGAAIYHENVRTNGSCPEQEPLLSHESERLQWEPLSSSSSSNNDNTSKSRVQPKFEAFMMTGEHILNISRMPPTTTIIPKQQKKIDNLRYHNSHAHHLRHQQQQQHNSVPNSPNEMDLGLKNNYCSNSVNTSPMSCNRRDITSPTTTITTLSSSSSTTTTATLSGDNNGKSYNNFIRTSRSEDQLQVNQTDSIIGMSTINIDCDDDLTSSLNTLLDTRIENNTDCDRIVWTYNAPMTADQQHKLYCHTLSNGSSSSSSQHTTSSSPLHSISPASPTSVSSSIMSSQSGSKHYNNGYQQQHQQQQQHHKNNGDFSMSEVISNISSPDYHDDDNSIGIRDYCMEISDHSDSDSTLLVSEPKQKYHHQHHKNCGNSTGSGGSDGDHRIVIQVKGSDRNKIANYYDKNYQVSSDMLEQYYENEEDITRETGKMPSPQSSEDESDVDSLHSFHYSPKAVDLPSAIRLAKRLYCLDGFKKSDVSRHLSKNNDFSRAVAEEYLKYFDFENDTLDIALRKFLKQFSLTGETQERERVLVHFSKRFLDCNPGSFNSQDAVHTLTCAIMLLNTDLHGQNISRKMTCNEFIENLTGLNECENFPREVLKQLYHAIKNYPLEWARDDETDDGLNQMKVNEPLNVSGTNPFLDVPISSNAVEYKKGYVMRKCCFEANAKRTPFHKRSWKMFYCTLWDLVLYLHKDENGFRKNQMSDNFHNAIRIHHSLATKANDYTKKQYVFRLQTADQAEYLFQTSDSKELQSWIDTINFVCASFSSPPLEAAVGSQKKFQRPLLPCSHTKLNLREQLRDHEERVLRLEAELEEHRKTPPERGSKSLIVQNYKEKEAYLNYEVKRYRTYAYMLRSRMSQYPELGISLVENSIGEVDEASGVQFMDINNSGGGNGGCNIIPPPIPNRPSPSTNRKGLQ